ncbi:distal tail protein Dit [Cytobacillus firmus]
MENLSFNGITKGYVQVVSGSNRQPWAPVERDYQEVPNRPGAYMRKKKKTKPRPLPIPVLIKAKDIADLQKLKEDLAAWLVHDDPKPLILDDEPDRIYYAVVDGSFDPDELVNFGQGVIPFICPDPYKYGEEQTAEHPIMESASDDFAGKVAGSTVENPHVAKYHDATSLGTPSAIPTEFYTLRAQAASNYEYLNKVDNNLSTKTGTTNGAIAQHLFSFNLIALIKRKFGFTVPGANLAAQVQWLKTNISQITANWWGKGTNKLANPSGKANFAGKVSGSTVENPHVLKYDQSTSLVNPATGGTETGGGYPQVSTLNGAPYYSVSPKGNGAIAQHLFSFNLIEYVQRKYGVTVPGATTEDKVQWLKDNVNRFTANWHGFGSGPAGNNARFTLWKVLNSVYHSGNVVASGTVTKVTHSNISAVSDYIDSSGFVHFLAYADASDGTTASTINTDYVELEVELKSGQDKGTLARWHSNTNSWISFSGHSNLKNTISKVEHAAIESVPNMVDSNGVVHFLAYAEPSNGIAPSTIETDYISLDLKLVIPEKPAVVNNTGSAESNPIIEVTFTAPATEFTITLQETGEFVRVIWNFVAGSKLEIDLAKRKVIIDGNVRMSAYYWRNKPFKILPGSNNLLMSPAGVATTQIKFRPRWM